MRSVVGRKDVFLSYAHINMEFALRVKVWAMEASLFSPPREGIRVAEGVE